MKNTYPERKVFNLIDSNEVEEMQLVKDILKSPLGLLQNNNQTI